MKLFRRNKKGVTLVEVVIGASIITASLVVLVTVYSAFLSIELSNVDTVKATLLAEEGIEALRLMRSQSWSQISGLTVGSSYYFSWNGSTWVSTATNTYIDSVFERKFVLGNVYRNGSDRIASSGTLDTNARLVTVTVSWKSKAATSTRAISTYFTNLFNN